MATELEKQSFLWSCLPTAPNNLAGTLALSAANTWLGFTFVSPSGKTLSKVKAFVSAVSGTPAASDATLDLFSDNVGIPNTSVEGPKTATGTPTASAWLEWTGFTTGLTAGTRYWLIFKNANASPGTHNFTYRYGTTQTAPVPIISTQGTTAAGAWGWNKLHSTDGGSTWVTAIPNVFGWRLEYSDGSFDGLPYSNIVIGAAATWVYGNREVGVLVTTPNNATLNIKGVAFLANKVGTPTGSLRARLYNGVTLLATSANSIPATFVGTGNPAHAWEFYFATTQSVAPGSSLRVVLSETTQSDTSSNVYRSYEYTVENDANSRALCPFGNCQQTITTDATANPVVFSETNTVFTPFALILDSDGEFAATSGGGGVSRRLYGGRVI